MSKPRVIPISEQNRMLQCPLKKTNILDPKYEQVLYLLLVLQKSGTQPRIASLQNSSNSQHLCGATVISPSIALTAAHCVQFTPDEYQLQLKNCCVEAEESPPIAQVMEIITHELYDRRSRAHDIALLRISLDLDDITGLDDTALPHSSFGVSGECTIYGYGSRYPGTSEISEILLAAKLQIMSLDKCREILGPIAPEYNSGMICASGEGVDSCQGDSGSPLICGSTVEGVSSHGLSCGVPGVPGVYTSIGAHLSWIRAVMQRGLF